MFTRSAAMPAVTAAATTATMTYSLSALREGSLLSMRSPRAVPHAAGSLLRYERPAASVEGGDPDPGHRAEQHAEEDHPWPRHRAVPVSDPVTPYATRANGDTRLGMGCVWCHRISPDLGGEIGG